jgi:hypothetical protein
MLSQVGICYKRVTMPPRLPFLARRLGQISDMIIMQRERSTTLTITFVLPFPPDFCTSHAGGIPRIPSPSTLYSAGFTFPVPIKQPAPIALCLCALELAGLVKVTTAFIRSCIRHLRQQYLSTIIHALYQFGLTCPSSITWSSNSCAFTHLIAFIQRRDAVHSQH